MIKFANADVLPSVRLKTGGPTTSAFIERGVDFRDAGRLIAGLPYGRNSNRSDHSLVLSERRGTCSTKHALLTRLAQEQKLQLSLWVGIYEMDGLNTRGSVRS